VVHYWGNYTLVEGALNQVALARSIQELLWTPAVGTSSLAYAKRGT
jgi:hypothetical protein